MNGLGGRTMWYCTSCGDALSVGRAVCSCGGKSQPSEVTLAEQTADRAGLLARTWRAVARPLGLWDGAP